MFHCVLGDWLNMYQCKSLKLFLSSFQDLFLINDFKFNLMPAEFLL